MTDPKNAIAFMIQNGVSGPDLDSFLMTAGYVSRQTMQNTFDWIHENYGSIQEYIKQELDVTQEEILKLQEHFLEDCAACSRE